MKTKKTVWIVVIISLLAAGGIGGYFYLSNPAASANSKEASVATVEAKNGSVSVLVEGPSVVEPYLSQSIRSKIGGVIVQSPEEGDEFKKGDIVIKFDSSDVDKAYRQAQLKLEQAKVNRDKAKDSLSKLKDDLGSKEQLLSTGAISKSEVDSAKDAVSNAEYALKLAELTVKDSALSVDTALDNRNAAHVKAPFNGIILSVNVGRGDLVSPGNLLAYYADLSKVRLKAEVDEFDIGKVKQGLPVTITSDALGDTKIRSRVERVSPQAEVVNNISIFKISVVVANKDRKLMPGMSADVSVLIRSDKGIVVPSKSVSSVRTRSYIKVFEDGAVKTKKISIGANDGINVAVLEGLRAGELVVIPGSSAFSLSTGTATSGSSIIPVTIPGTGVMK